MDVPGRQDKNYLRTKVNSSGIRSSKIKYGGQEEYFSGRGHEISISDIGMPVVKSKGIDEKITSIIH